MPEVGGKITAAEKEKIDAWLRTRWPHNYKCPICQSENWTLAEHFVELRTFSGGALMVGGPVYPNVLIISVPCGYSVLMNAGGTGIAFGPTPPDQKPVAEEQAPPAPERQDEKDV